MKLKAFSSAIIVLILCQAGNSALVSDKILKQVSDGLRDVNGWVDSPEREAVRRRALDGLSDEEIIRALVEWMYRHSSESHEMVPSLAKKILISPQREIQDVSELRRLMNAETDSNRFFMLSKFSTFFEARYGESFMVERARGLTMTGRAAKYGQGQTEYRLSDISLYTYDTIVSKLEKLDSPFTKNILPTLEGKPEAAQVAELARWMKANWPGCEGLAVREKDGERPARKPSSNASTAGGTDTKTGRESGEVPSVDSSEGGPTLIAVVGGCILVAIAGLFFFLRRQSR